MAAAAPGAGNVFIPTTGGGNLGDALIVDFSRNPKDFSLARWCRYVPVTLGAGRYVRMTVEEAGRILNSNGANFEWPDGVERPLGNGNDETFEFQPYLTKRRSFACNTGKKTADQAVWDIVGQKARIRAQQAMTFRSNIAVVGAQTTGNYDSTHYGDVTGLGSLVTGKWDVSTTARNDIKKSLDYGADVIRKDTLGVVKPSDLIVVMSPGCARKISVSQEIVDYIKGSPDAIKYLKGDLGPNAAYGLPEYLFGYQVVVEDSVKVTNRKGGTAAKSYCCDDTKPFMCARPDGLIGGDAEAPSLSTHTLFMLEEMTMESEFDSWNRLTKAAVTEDYDYRITSPVSGFLFTAAVAA